MAHRRRQNFGTASAAEEVAVFEKVMERLEDLGLSIAEGKATLAATVRCHNVFTPYGTAAYRSNPHGSSPGSAGEAVEV
jgi:hypothetical protein